MPWPVNMRYVTIFDYRMPSEAEPVVAEGDNPSQSENNYS